MVDVGSVSLEQSHRFVDASEAERLRATGFTQFVLPPSSLVAVDLLYDIFQRFDTRGLFYLANDSQLEVPSDESDPYRFVVIRAEANPRMRWLWAQDAHTLDVFSELLTPEVRAQLSLASGGPIHLNAAHFIVSAGSILDEASISHYDFFSPAIRRSSAFSLITPVSAAHPKVVGGLELWPWTDIEKKSRTSSRAYRHDVKTSCKVIAPYYHGTASVVDGKVLHRTQPYDLSGDAETAFSDFKAHGISAAGIEEAIAGGMLRVLICVNASTMDAQSCSEFEGKLQGQASTGYMRQKLEFQICEREMYAEASETYTENDDTDDDSVEDDDSDVDSSEPNKGSSSNGSSSVANEAVLEPEIMEISDAAKSGDGSVDNVGIRMSGNFQCLECRQRFDTEKTKQVHWKFMHDPSRHMED